MKQILLGLLALTLPAILTASPATRRTDKKHRHTPVAKVRAVPVHTSSVTSRRTARYRRSTKRVIAAHPIPAAMRAEAFTTVSERLDARQAHFENPAALVPFFELLSQAQQLGQPVHILQFGDSHTASDDWVNAMRIEFQTKYGSGGPGFVHAGRPYKGYRRFDASGSNSTGWITEGTLAHLGDGQEGLSGVSISTSRPGETVTLDTSGDLLEVYYLQQPGGGSLQFSSDGNPVDTISTDGPLGPGFYSFTPAPGTHHYELRTTTYAPVRLFGWTSDNKQGLTFETLGINGAQANILLGWDQSIWSAEVARRNPALIILAYGTNEANSRRFDPEQYRADLTAVIQRLRKASQVASILLIGPPDCGRGAPLLHLSEVIAIQKELAPELGAAFWDLRDRMGGSGATVEWVRAGLGQADHIHLTGDGYRMIGRAIFDELELEYATFRSTLPAQTVQTGFEHEQTREDH